MVAVFNLSGIDVGTAEQTIITMMSKLESPMAGLPPSDPSQLIPDAYYAGEFLASGIGYLLSKASQWLEILQSDKDPNDAANKVIADVLNVIDATNLSRRIVSLSYTYKSYLVDTRIVLTDLGYTG
jgi:hypothetical protein